MNLGAWSRSHVRSHGDDDALWNALGDAPVLAIGEAGHGAREPLHLRNRIVRLLADRDVLAYVALETDLLAARALDDYVQGAPGDLEALAATHLGYGFGLLADNVELLQWMRAHNRSARHPLRFVGFDIPGGDARGELSGAHRAPELLASWLRRLDSTHAKTVADRLDAFASRLSADAMRAMAGAALASDRAFLAEVAMLIDAHAPALDGIEPDGHGWATRALASTRAALDFLALFPPLPADPRAIDDDLIGPILDASGIRDALMADHVAWFRTRLPEGRRLVVFAADGHVIAGDHVGGLWSRHPGRGAQLGRHLRTRLGHDYRVLITVAAKPLPDAPHAEPGSLERAMSSLGVTDALLDLDGAPADAWLDAPQSINTNGPYLQSFVPRVSCDVVALLPASTPAARTAFGRGAGSTEPSA